MLDRRPLLARKFAEAIYDNMIARGLSDDPEVRDPIIEEWVALILEDFTSDSIPFPRDGGWVSCYDQATAQKFIDKYPDLQRLIDLCKAEALRRWPEATFRLEIMSDPEGCHICCEGQHLTLEIQTDLDFYGPNGEEYPINSPYHAANKEWDRWEHGWYDDEDGDGEPPEGWDRTPYRLLEAEIGDVARLFRVDVKWKQESEGEE